MTGDSSSTVGDPIRGSDTRGAHEATVGEIDDPVVVLDLLDVALTAGASVPHALRAVGEVVKGRDGAALERAGTALVLGASWRASWSEAPSHLSPVVECLESTWSTGAPSGPALRARAAALRRDSRRAAREAAARLGVRLVLPLGLCFLPAFVLLGLVPLMLSLGRGLLG
jgi:pilus assembly protein TadC